MLKATVRGKFQFPIQMLMEDECFPLTLNDIEEIVKSFDDIGEREYEITLAKTNSKPWSMDIWKKLGFRLVRVWNY